MPPGTREVRHRHARSRQFFYVLPGRSRSRWRAPSPARRAHRPRAASRRGTSGDQRRQHRRRVPRRLDASKPRRSYHGLNRPRERSPCCHSERAQLRLSFRASAAPLSFRASAAPDCHSERAKRVEESRSSRARAPWMSGDGSVRRDRTAESDAEAAERAENGLPGRALCTGAASPLQPRLRVATTLGSAFGRSRWAKCSDSLIGSTSLPRLRTPASRTPDPRTPAPPRDQLLPSSRTPPSPLPGRSRFLDSALRAPLGMTASGPAGLRSEWLRATPPGDARFPAATRPPHCLRNHEPSRAHAMAPPQLARHVAMRYVQPLREGGSLPAVVDTDGGGLVRREVPRRGAGSEGARRRAHRRPDRASTSSCPFPSWRSSSAATASDAASRTPRSRSCSAGATARTSGCAISRAPSTSTAAPRATWSTPELAARHRLARRLHDEPRPHAPQPQPARSGIGARGSSTTAPRSTRTTTGPRSTTREPTTSFPLIRSHVLLARQRRSRRRGRGVCRAR